MITYHQLSCARFKFLTHFYNVRSNLLGSIIISPTFGIRIENLSDKVASKRKAEGEDNEILGLFLKKAMQLSLFWGCDIGLNMYICTGHTLPELYVV